MCARGVELNEPQLSGNALRIERAQGEPISERDSDCGSAERKRHRAAVVRTDVGSSCECERGDPRCPVAIRATRGQIPSAVRDKAARKGHGSARVEPVEEERVVSVQLGVERVVSTHTCDHVAVLHQRAPARTGVGFVRGDHAVVSDRAGGGGRNHDVDCCRGWKNCQRTQRADYRCGDRTGALSRSSGDKGHTRRERVRESDTRGGARPVVDHDQLIRQIAAGGGAQDDRGGRSRAYELQSHGAKDVHRGRREIVRFVGVGFVAAHADGDRLLAFLADGRAYDQRNRGGGAGGGDRGQCTQDAEFVCITRP